MTTITRYMAEDAGGEDLTANFSDSYIEARDLAYKNRGKVVGYDFELSDTYLVDDFTEEEEAE